MVSSSSYASWNSKAAELALGTAQALSSLVSPRVAVFCYHRILSPEDGFQGYAPNISATVSEFLEQMQLIRRNFTPISLRQLLSAIADEEELPARPALVTFDDGYGDNGRIAWPIMRSLGIPGVVFLATDHIGGNKPFLWDYVAYCFERAAWTSPSKEVNLPLLGRVRLGSMAQRRQLAAAWIGESKKHQASGRWPSAYALAVALNVQPDATAFSRLYLSWDEVRSLAAEGLDFGGHTRSHPILSKATREEAWEEIDGCQRVLRENLGHPAAAFAYPNGSSADFRPEHEEMVLAAGFRIAFGLGTGGSCIGGIAHRPTRVRRVYVGPRDGLLRMTAKLISVMAAPV